MLARRGLGVCRMLANRDMSKSMASVRDVGYEASPQRSGREVLRTYEHAMPRSVVSAVGSGTRPDNVGVRRFGYVGWGKAVPGWWAKLLLWLTRHGLIWVPSIDACQSNLSVRQCLSYMWIDFGVYDMLCMICFRTVRQ